MRKKLKDACGLTLVELLCAVAILVMLCLMMNTCLSMAMKSYQNITAASETQLLLSSLSDALTDKLRYCVVTETETPGVAGAPSTFDYNWSVGEVTLTLEPADEDSDPKGMVLVGGRKLLPEEAYGELRPDGNRRYQVTKAEVKSPNCSGATPVFTVTLKVEETSGNAATEEMEFTVRCLNPVKKEEDE